MLICIYDEKTISDGGISYGASFIDCTDNVITEGLVKDNWDRFIEGGSYIIKGTMGYAITDIVYDANIPLDAKEEIEKKLHRVKRNKKYSLEQSIGVIKLLGTKVSLDEFYELLFKFNLESYVSDDSKISDVSNTIFIYKGVDTASEEEIRWLSVIQAFKNARDDGICNVSELVDKYKIVDVSQREISTSRHNYLISILEDIDSTFDSDKLRCYVKEDSMDIFSYDITDEGVEYCEKYEYFNTGALTSSVSSPELLTPEEAEEKIVSSSYEIGFSYNKFIGYIDWI